MPVTRCSTSCFTTTVAVVVAAAMVANASASQSTALVQNEQPVNPQFSPVVNFSSGVLLPGGGTLGANFSVRKLDGIYFAPEARYYAYADIIDFDNFYYPDSYDTNVGVFSSADGRHNWTYHGIVIARGPSGAWDAGGIASPGATVVGDSIFVGYAAEPLDGGAGNRGIGVAVATHPLGPFAKQAKPVALDICGGSGRCDDVVMQTEQRVEGVGTPVGGGGYGEGGVTRQRNASSAGTAGNTTTVVHLYHR